MSKRLLLLVPTSTYRAEAFVKAIKRLGVELSLASEVPSALAHLHPVSLPAFDFSDLEASLSFVTTFIKDHSIDAVVAVDDQATLAAAAIATRLDLPGNTSDAVYDTQNKYRTRLRLQEYGLSCPDFRLVSIDEDPDAVAETLSFPVVMKPLMMGASRGVLKADDKKTFAERMPRVCGLISAQPDHLPEQVRQSLMIEAYLPGWEVAVEGIVTNGDLHVFTIFDKPDPLEGPSFPESIYVMPTCRTVTEQDDITRCVQSTIKALGLKHGPIHAEVRGDDTHVTLVEIAARSIGGLCSRVVQFADGRTLEDIILQHSLDPDMQIPDFAPGARGVMMMQAERAGELHNVSGADQARDVDKITEVIISSRPGQKLLPLPEGFHYTGFIFAEGKTAVEVEDALRRSADKLAFDIR